MWKWCSPATFPQGTVFPCHHFLASGSGSIALPSIWLGRFSPYSNLKLLRKVANGCGRPLLMFQIPALTTSQSGARLVNFNPSGLVSKSVLMFSYFY